MGLGLSIVSGIVVGFVGGVIIGITLVFFKTVYEGWKAKKNNKEIVELIKSKQEVKHGIEKKESRSSGRSKGRRFFSFGRSSKRESDVKEPITEPTSKVYSNEQRRIPISKSNFTFRD